MNNTESVSWLNRLEPHHRLVAALGVALLVYWWTSTRFDLPAQIMLTWLAYSLPVLLLTWFTILTAHPRQIRLLARLQDVNRVLIFFFVIVASSASLFAVIVLLQSAKGLSQAELLRHVLLSLASVFCAWWMVHTIFALRYAHLYYGEVQDNPGDESAGGLDFPEEKEPDYLDFVYFSFIIGMTCQVSDVQITSRRIRRLAWLHGILTFAYNTVIVALSINILSSLLEK